MQNMPIGIFRGDDTDAFSYQTIVGTIKTDLNLTGCKAVFRYLGFSMEFDPIPEDKKITIVIPADETKKFPPGLGYASLRVYDSEGRLKTFSNRIMVFVATKTPMFGSDEFEVDFNVRATLEPLKFFVGPNPDDFDEYRGYLEKVIDRASALKYGLAILLDAIDSDLGANDGVAATPVAVKAAYAAIIDKLTDDYYTADQTDEAIDRVAAYYITRNAAGDAFKTKAQLDSTTVFYSGGKVRTPTRNDYCVVLADETHDNAEYRYIYAVADGHTTGSWQPQFPVEGVMTVDQTVTKDSQNPVSGGGVWSMLWGALASLPTGVSSLYDWCVAQLAGKVPTSRKVNGKALSSDVTLTGADIAVSGTDPTKIDAALAGKATKADATLTPKYADEWIVNPVYPEGYTSYTGPTWSGSRWVIYYHGDSGIHDLGTSVLGTPYALSLSFQDGTTATRQSTEHTLIGYILGSQDGKPLASEAEAEALRTAVANKPIILDVAKHSRITVDGAELQVVLYWNSTRDRFFMTVQRIGTWLTQSGEWQSSAEAYTHTWKSGGVTYTATRAAGGWTTSVYINGVESPIDNIASRCAGKDLGTTAYAFYDTLNAYFATYDRDGNLISATYVKKGNIPYDRITITTGQLQDHAVQKVTLNAATTTLVLPALTNLSGKVSDFGIDMVNAYAPKVGGTPTPTAASFQLDGTLGTDYNLIVPDGETWSDMTALAPNEMAIYYFTLSAFQINDKPTWEVMKKIVELVPVPSAP